MSVASFPRPQSETDEANLAKVAGMLRDFGLALYQSTAARGASLSAYARTIGAGDATLAEKREVIDVLRAYAGALSKMGRHGEAAGVIAQADALERDRQGELVWRFAGGGSADSE